MASVRKALAMAAEELGTCFNTGEGGLHKDLERYGGHAVVQVASGRFGVDAHYLNAGAMIEIKIGQGAKPGIGGHLPGEKIGEEVSRTRMIPRGTDAISPAPHHDIYSIEDLRQLVFSLKEATRYAKPVAVKIAAVHNVAAIASGAARAGADVVVVDGFRGGTGAAPARIRDNVGIPLELALASVDKRLHDEGIRLLLQAKQETGLPIVTEIMSYEDIDLFEQVDLIQVGARNMQNFELLKRLGKQDKPILLKRGLANTIEEFLMSAEYIMAQGNEQVILCERGIRTFENATRNTLDLSAVPLLKKRSHLPVVVDPSHATGIPWMVEPMTLAAIAAGADGVMIEVHNDPPHALCDGAQSLRPEQFDALMGKVKKTAQFFKTLD